MPKLSVHFHLLVALLGLVLITTTGCRESEPRSTELPTSSGTIAELAAQLVDDPENPSLYAARAQYHYGRGNYGDAIQDMALAMRFDSINESYHHILADIYMDSYKSQLALFTMERCIRLFPESVSSWLKIAEMQIILLQLEPAAVSLRKVLEISPRNVDGLYLLAILYKEQGDLDRAIQSMQTVTEIESDHLDGWTMLGNFLDMKNDPSALQCFENAIAIDSMYPQGWHSKAYYLQNRDQVDEAIQIYQKLHVIAPDYFDAYLNAGILYLEKGNTTEAEAEFQQLIAMQPNNPMGHYYLGLTDESREAYALALEHFTTAGKLSPGNTRFALAIERMQPLVPVE